MRKPLWERQAWRGDMAAYTSRMYALEKYGFWPRVCARKIESFEDRERRGYRRNYSAMTKIV